MKTVSESEMMMSKIDENNYSKTADIEIPIQNLFDECLKFISIEEFMI
ncbi:MAG: hypothetical protein NC191_06260 [Muribaculaceae bacterium]|nr:hypothetical protein [Muribaculaceae bacterium]